MFIVAANFPGDRLIVARNMKELVFELILEERSTLISIFLYYVSGWALGDYVCRLREYPMSLEGWQEQL